MKTSHSSLLADTGLSEIELDRMGLTPIERDGDRLTPAGKGWNGSRDYHAGTLAPFSDQPWYEDEDVKRYLPRAKEWWGRS